MDFIDDIDFVCSLIGFESRLFDQFTDILDTIVRGTIDLDTVEHHLLIEGNTIGTLMTGIPVLEIRTIHSLCEDASTRRFPGSA